MADPLPASQPPIFQTLFRAKHSHLVSYPLGAEALSRALAGIPQYAVVKCEFVAGNSHQHLDRLVLPVVTATYQRRERNFNDGPDADARGVFLPRWTIRVYAVPKTLRHAVKTALADGLPNIMRPWFIDHAGISGKTGACALNLEYESAEARLIATLRTTIQPDRA